MLNQVYNKTIYWYIFIHNMVYLLCRPGVPCAAGKNILESREEQ